MTQPTVLDPSGLLKELLRSQPRQELIDLLKITEEDLSQWMNNGFTSTPTQELLLQYYCLSKQVPELYAKYGGTLPPYNIFKEFNFENIPLGHDISFSTTLLLRNRPTKIGGFEVNYPFGVPASALTGTSEWIKFYAKMGFDILTYKTVRTHERSAHKYPNWVFIPNPNPIFTKEDPEPPQIGHRQHWPEDPTNVTMANSFGVPSLSIKEWQEDVARAKSSLGSGQVLIVSVIGSTPKGNESFEHLRDDFVEAAKAAKAAGADIVELNFSCPNLRNPRKGDLYRSPEASSEISKAVYEALGRGETPLFIKISYLERDLLAEVIRANASYINGVVAINTIARPVIDAEGNNLFPSEESDRTKAGISGSTIKELAMEVVENLSELKRKQHYDFDILGVGGVTTSQDVQRYLNLGATGVQSCTGAWINPYLAIDTRFHISRVHDPRFTTVIERNGKINGSGGEVIMAKEKRTPQERSESLVDMQKKPALAKLLQKINNKGLSVIDRGEAIKQLIKQAEEVQEKKQEG